MIIRKGIDKVMDIEFNYKCSKCKADTIHVRVYIQRVLYDLCKECHDKQSQDRYYIADRELDKRYYPDMYAIHRGYE